MLEESLSSKILSLKSTKEFVLNGVKNFKEEDILLKLYMNLPKEIKFIANDLEKIILLAKINEKAFNDNFEKIIKDIKNKIIDNQLYEEYYLFTYLVNSKLSNLSEVSISTLYLSIVVEIFNQLAETNYLIWGFKEDGTPIYKKEPYQELTSFMNKLKYGKINKHEALKIMNKYSLSKNLKDTLTYLVEMDRVYRNMISIMAGVIREDDFDIYPDEENLDLLNLSHNIREWRKTEDYINILKERRYTLPKEGVRCIFDNISDIKEIYLKEKIFSNYTALIFKIKTINNKESSGLFIPHLDLYFDIFKSRSLLSEQSYKNFVLEVYSILTTDIDLNYKKMRSICMVDDIKNPTGYYMQQPLMQVFKKKIELIQISRSRKKTNISYHAYKREDFIPISVSIASYIRKLPEGYKASEKAIEMAERYGYKLKDGETFVSPFKKKVLKKQI